MPADPITVEVIRGALTYAAEEMGIALRNAAYSPNIKERMDHSCAIFDDRRRLVAQAEHIPVHLGSMIYGVKEGLGRFKDGFEEGDVLAFNNPYISGTHLPDLTLIQPAFHKGEVVAYVANKAHHSDIGGRAPGSMAADSTEIYQEGLIIPLVKLVKRGSINQDIVSMITSNVRTPKVTYGDLKAQLAAGYIGVKRCLEVLERYGLETFLDSVEAMIIHSERVLRDKLEEMRNGVYSAEDYLEGIRTDGWEGKGRKGEGKKGSLGNIDEDFVTIRATLEIKGSNLTVDYTGTSHQVRAPVNAVFGVTMAGVYYTVKCITDPNLHVNEGCFRPITIKAPEGTVVNPIPPAPVAAGNVETSQRNVDVLLKAFSYVVPERVCAACQGTMNNLLLGGYDERRAGRPWSFYETIGGGYGGRMGLDGVNGVQCHMTNTMNTPIEAIEAEYPMRMVSYFLRKDSGGSGKWRGGMGIERSFILLSESATLSLLAERSKIPPYGLLGGKDGKGGEYFVVKAGGKRKIRLNSKCTVRIKRGDRVVIRTPGGGGYGDPTEREKEKVTEDFQEGYISRARLHSYYLE